MSGTRWQRTILGALAAGTLLGAVNSLSNVLGSPYSPHSLRPHTGVFPLEVLAAVVGTVWAWCLAAFAVGWVSPSVRRAAPTGALALVAASVVYYVSDHVFGLDDELSAYEMAYWVLISFIVGPVFGIVGFLAGRPRGWSLIPGLAAPGIVVIFGVVLSFRTGSDHIQPWPAVVTWAIVVTLSLAIAGRWILRRSAADPAAPAPSRAQ